MNNPNSSKNPKLEMMLDTLFFPLLVAAMSFFVVHGKELSKSMFTKAESMYHPEYLTIGISASLLFAALFYQLVRHSEMAFGFKIVWVSLVGLVVSGNIVMVHPQFLTFFSLLYVYIIASGVVVIEPYLKQDMDKEFWKEMLGLGLKMLRFILILFIAGVAVLRFIEEKNTNGVDALLTTLFYPTMTMIATFIVVGFWVLFPCWKKMVAGYSTSESKFNNDVLCIRVSNMEERLNHLEGNIGKYSHIHEKFTENEPMLDAGVGNNVELVTNINHQREPVDWSDLLKLSTSCGLTMDGPDEYERYNFFLDSKKIIHEAKRYQDTLFRTSGYFCGKFGEGSEWRGHPLTSNGKIRVIEAIDPAGPMSRDGQPVFASIIRYVAEN